VAFTVLLAGSATAGGQPPVHETSRAIELFSGQSGITPCDGISFGQTSWGTLNADRSCSGYPETQCFGWAI